MKLRHYILKIKRDRSITDNGIKISSRVKEYIQNNENGQPRVSTGKLKLGAVDLVFAYNIPSIGNKGGLLAIVNMDMDNCPSTIGLNWGESPW